MAPILNKSLLPDCTIDAILNHPLPTWIERKGEGNVAVSEKYLETLGVAAAGNDWETYVLNPEYITAYLKWVKLGPSDKQWTHKLDWRMPDTGEVLKLESRAWSWSDGQTIQGEV